MLLKTLHALKNDWGTGLDWEWDCVTQYGKLMWLKQYAI